MTHLPTRVLSHWRHAPCLWGAYLGVSRRLQHRRLIIRLFLVVLLLIAGVGFAGSLQSGLEGISGGQTSLAYWIASQRNHGRLQPLTDEPDYLMHATSDTDLQKYFFLDQEDGVLSLRDGLQTISTQMNPLKVFPLRIVKVKGEGPEAQRSIGLFVRVVMASRGDSAEKGARLLPKGQKASKLPAAASSPPCPDPQARGTEISISKSSMKCLDDFFGHARFEGVFDKSEELVLRQLYKDQLNDVMRPTLLDAPSSPGVPKAPEPAPSPEKIYEITLPYEDAVPGLTLFDYANPERTLEAGSGGFRMGRTRASSARQDLVEHLRRGLDEILVGVDRWVVGLLRLRLTFLVAVGFLLPLVIVALNHSSLVIRCALEPYLLLFGAQVVTVLVAYPLLGEGLVIWVGLIYTWLRVIQVMGLLGIGAAPLWRRQLAFALAGGQGSVLGDASNRDFSSAVVQSEAVTQIERRGLLRGVRLLVMLLWLELVLWGVNGVGLLWHVVSVFLRWDSISPA